MKKTNRNKIIRSFINAASYGNLKLMNKLLKDGLDVNSFDSEGDTALHTASQYGHLSVVKMLIKVGANVEIRNKSSSQTPLILATLDLASAKYNGFEKDVLQVILALIQSGANVNAQDNDGWTALIGAVNARSVEAVKILIEANANPNAKDHDGNTALSMAKETENTEIIELLLEAGAKD